MTNRVILPLLCLAALLPAGCASPASSSNATTETGRPLASAAVTGVNPTHGNVYTTIAPDRYEPLGLTPGMRLHVVFSDAAIVMSVGRTYTDVPTGDPVAVLHREGLTFAIRDGDFAETYGIAIGDRFTIARVGQAATPRVDR